MQNFLRKNLGLLGILVILLVLYFILRLPHLTLLPVFADEAIYIRWAQIMRAEPTLRFVSMMDGKTPLFMWVMIPFFKIFSDPLLAGRFLSVLAGLGTVSGVLFIGWFLFNRRVGLWAAFLVTITPFFVFFDRMALVDSMLCAFSVWSIALALVLIKFPRWDLAMILGYLMGGALLTKTPGFFTVVTMPLTVLTFPLRKAGRQSRIIKLFLLWMVAIVITLGIYNILRLGPGFSNLNSRNQDYVLSPTILLVRPWDPFIPHLGDLTDFWPKLLGYVVLGLLSWGIVLAFWKRKLPLFTLLFLGGVPLLIEMALLRTFTARYILFPMPYFILIAAYAANDLTGRLKKKIGEIGGIVVIGGLLVIWPAFFVYQLNTDLAAVPLPRIERQGYLSEWTAGYGLKEIAQYLDNASKKEPIVIGTQGAFGTLPEGLQIYLDKNRQIAIITAGEVLTRELKTTAEKHPTFFIANNDFLSKFDPALEKIKEYPKIPGVDGKQGSIIFYRVHYLPESSDSAIMKGDKSY